MAAGHRVQLGPGLVLTRMIQPSRVRCLRMHGQDPLQRVVVLTSAGRVQDLGSFFL